MPDNIATIDGQSAMVYQGATPWHMLGVKINGTESTEEIARIAKLDWNVELMPMYVKYNDAAAKDGFSLERVPNRRAVVRRPGEVVLGTVGDAYVALQNSQAFELLDLARREFGVQIETMGALGRGEKVWALAKMPNHFDVVGGDRVNGYFLLHFGHDGATPLTGRLTMVRVVCQNTVDLALATSKALIKLNHTQAAQDKLDQVAQMIKDMVHVMSITQESFADMARHILSADELHNYVEDVMSVERGTLLQGALERRRDRIIELAASGKGVDFSFGSVWTAFNAVTEYVDHVRPAEAAVGDLATGAMRLRKANTAALFGSGAAMKARALKLAESIIA